MIHDTVARAKLRAAGETNSAREAFGSDAEGSGERNVQYGRFGRRWMGLVMKDMAAQSSLRLMGEVGADWLLVGWTWEGGRAGRATVVFLAFGSLSRKPRRMV